VKTGEAQDERVERVVPEQPLESHEEAAETFLALSAGLAVLVTAGLARGRIGGVARGLGAAGAAGLVAVAAYVGHSGGTLVYRYGAASAYTATSPRVAAGASGVSVGDVQIIDGAARRDADGSDDR
jgi:hypothetical protein